MSRDLLIEIGLEEMPARFVTNSIEQLTDKLKNWFAEKQIEIGDVKSYSTPRRLAVLINDVSEAQEDIQEEAKGPAKKIALDESGNWSKAAIGFTRGQGMSVDDIYFKEINGVEYAHVEKFTKGQETKSLLPELKQIITGLTFPKNMRWANEEIKYIRPIKWLVAMFGTEAIPFEITDVATATWTRGHRFLGDKVVISSPEEYVVTLLGQYVIANSQERKDAIVSQLKKIEEENGWIIPIDEELLEEVNNLVEYPTALFGRFEEEFLELPEEVLITSMKEHQRYFPVKSKDGKLLPFFVTVRNGDHQHLDTVARGNEKVLRARLADAAFFYKEDQKMEIAKALEKFKTIVFHEEIGTLAEKVERVKALTNKLTAELNFTDADKKVAARAAEISKFDLVTNMVYEFPELQGFMGEKYAIQKGEDALVAKAINEHYMPRNAEDSPAETNAGAALAIVEKLDTIASTIAIGVIPSGSQDPYALRRQATGIVQTLIHKNWDIELEQLISLSIEMIESANFAKLSREELEKELLSFFKLRIKHLLQERGVRYDLIDALLAGQIGVIASLVRKAEILNVKKDEEGFKESMEALSRVINISSKADAPGEIETTLFENEYERNLYNQLVEVEKTLESNVSEQETYELLVSLKDRINDYFDHTMVMVDDEKLKANRLNLMVKLANRIKDFANVTEIIVK
ncbi:glycine--tRNA ligase subunit beta [Robertmurraya kyonggiensis]|uniref:Glycine--tRNA ligase beta subunit n=1 Tax=Robertmurraya kyonggiensis TaxID=1037680 RepID=A0A4U1DF87_9BACI|nr:glycine--tRNA ligase subunit beta [Robertmurraya kyonggiensis]TKC19946.1 glycine--tRNA ligase subunit beta [Robertmurraya kyonggiensis]